MKTRRTTIRKRTMKNRKRGRRRKRRKRRRMRRLSRRRKRREKKNINGTHFIAVVPRGFNSTISVSNIGLSKLSLNLFFIFLKFQAHIVYCIIK